MPNTLARPGPRQPTPRHQARTWTVPVQPWLERDTQSQFWDQIDNAISYPRVVIDLRRVRFVDRAGLHALVCAIRRIRAHGGQVHLRSAPGTVHTLLIQIGIDRVAPLHRGGDPSACCQPSRRPEAVPPASSRRPTAVPAVESSPPPDSEQFLYGAWLVRSRHPARSPPGSQQRRRPSSRRPPDLLPAGAAGSWRQDIGHSQPRRPLSMNRKVNMLNVQTAVEPRVVRFFGVLDAWQAPKVRQAFNQITSPGGVIVDLEKVSFVDSAGLGALIGGIRRVRHVGGTIAMCTPSRSVAKVFEMTGVDRILPVAATHDEAAAALNPIPEQRDLDSGGHSSGRIN